ncbi:hypothetical protein RHMOL_Rhmol08G0190500 [Rhododendron molle]|uniref:Uncharacterized protein n=1 Tax=Rhododendron molle TaxID=49168 RepID=A0ACC0MPZ2_RHOML|nr:hypothetical protein RHMOL_Rhmol08G0190500 [Rhododendron molle]
MADSMISMEKIKAFWHSQVHDEQQWAQNMKVIFRPVNGCDTQIVVWACGEEQLGNGFKDMVSLQKLLFGFLYHPFLCPFPQQKLFRAAGLFAGSILLMRNFGDLMAV